MTNVIQPQALVLTPGASADRDHPTLVMLEAALPELHVERLTLGTTSTGAAMKKVRAAAQALVNDHGIPAQSIVYGGRSFGGRVCSMCVADGLPAAGLVLLSYPLHPPGKPDRLRVEHFSQITVPSLFVSGQKDPFGSPAEFEKELKSIPAPVTFHTVTGNHSPRATQDEELVRLIRAFLGL